LRPLLVDLRARKPILCARFLRWGRNVGCMILSKKEGQGDRSRSGVSRTGLGRFWCSRLTSLRKATRGSWAPCRSGRIRTSRDPSRLQRPRRATGGPEKPA
jgi:hypothetical protein